MIINELVEYALSKEGKRKIRDVRAGLGYTSILLDDNSCGLAYTFRGELGFGCGIIDEAGSLIGKNCSEVIPWLKSDSRLKAAIGLAAINAVINRPDLDYDKGNVTTALTVSSSDSFGMVGEFKPILREINNKTEKIYVFEQNSSKDSGQYSAADIPLYLPKCDVIVVTATSIINHTIEEVLANCKTAREVCLVGPSTPLCTEIFKGYNVTLLAGDIVTNPELTLQIVSQGGGTMAMKKSIQNVLVRI